MFIKDFVEKSGIKLPNNWSTTWQTEIQNNYIAIEFATDTTRVETYTQDASISRVDVLSNVGGQSGLWIGISFLSIMELIEMIYRLIKYSLRRLPRRARKNTNELHSNMPM